MYFLPESHIPIASLLRKPGLRRKPFWKEPPFSKFKLILESSSENECLLTPH
jgi:hypothetical protein